MKIIPLWAYRAAVSAIVVLAVAFYYILDSSVAKNQGVSFVYYSVEDNIEAKSRYIILPDRSVVVLHRGSVLKVDTLSFGNGRRSVELRGQAYFDIKHNGERPFVVYAGKSIITVLGTAFSIKSLSGNFQVIVTQGKVRVEEGRKSSLVIAGQQIENNFMGELGGAIAADVQAGTKWIGDGLKFNHQRLDSIVTHLEQRYQVPIRVVSPEIAKSRISAVNSFKGTESIEEILMLICPVVRATFRKENGVILIRSEERHYK